MLKLQNVLKDVGFNEKDRENMKKIAPIIEEHKDEIVEETTNMLYKDPEFVKAARKNNFPVSVVKNVARTNLDLMLSSDFGEEYEKKVFQYVKNSTSKAGAMQDFSVLVVVLVLLNAIDKLSSHNLDNFVDLSKTVMKVVSVFLTIKINLYDEQLLGYFLRFTGMSRALFEREMSLEIKKESEKKV